MQRSKLLTLVALIGAGIQMQYAVSADSASAAERADPLTHRVKHGFADSVYGQIHYLTAKPDANVPRKSWKTSLVMFHQSPLSSQEFAPLVAEMGRDRIVIALDTPGQGLSDGPASVVTIADYAAVMDVTLTGLGYGARKPVDVFANHTGVWIAGELAIRNPKLVRRLVLNGVYLVPESIWRANVERLRLEHSSGEFFETVSTYLPRARQYYLDRGMSDADWGRMVVSSLTPLQRREFGHVAAFRYAAEAPTRLPLITQPTSLWLIDDGIADRTRSAIPLFRNLTGVVERMEWREGLFYTRTSAVAAELRKALE